MFHYDHNTIKTCPVAPIYLYIIFSHQHQQEQSLHKLLLSSETDNVIEHSNPSNRFLSAKIIGCADVELSNIISYKFLCNSILKFFPKIPAD
jgi:hypothetical protein